MGTERYSPMPEGRPEKDWTEVQKEIVTCLPMVTKAIADIIRHLYDSDTVNDLVQETMRKAIEHQDQYEGKNNSSVSTWLNTIARHTALDFLRKKRTLRNVEIPNNSQVVREEGGTWRTQEGESRDSGDLLVKKIISTDLLNHLLPKISKKSRNLLLLKYAEGYSLKEIMQMTGLNASAVKIKLLRARKKLVGAYEKLPKSQAYLNKKINPTE